MKGSPPSRLIQLLVTLAPLLVIFFISPTLVEVINDADNDIPLLVLEPQTCSNLSNGAVTIEDKIAANELDLAMIKYGFVKLAYPKPETHDSLSALLRAADVFFSKPQQFKDQYTFGDYGNDKGGYTSIGVESVNPNSGNKDSVQNYVFRDDSVVDHHNPELAKPAVAYFREMARLTRCLNSLSSLALDLPLQNFNEVTFPSPPSDKNGLALRIAKYEPVEGIRYGEHTDYQMFTILYTGGEEGLQVQLPSGEFEDVTFEDGFVVNAGDFWAGITNGRWRSVTHRVKGGGARIAVPFFTGPRGSWRVTVGGEELTAGEWLAWRLAKSNK